MESLTINITNFEGPFDLLLHLLKVNKMKIQEIQISEITSQYLTYLHSMQELDMDVASDFLVMAATLLEIKSREMLPKYKEAVDEEELKEKLVLRIEEYEVFKEMAETFEERFRLDQVILTKRAETIPQEEVPLSELLRGVTMENLYLTYTSLMNRQKEKLNRSFSRPRKLEREEFKIEDKMEELERFLYANSSVNFNALLQKSRSKAEAIVMFLAVLELTRNRRIRISQEDVFSEIIIEKGENDGR
ncbi:segregation/condensation protein A [Proteiniclasticum sp. BAD-10]|jgi:segregation and condensation protein A|uniref:Segregation and condensation protein A n=1 Tax=Proteiniclasticum sediminis TaxID=2804028 RepID=A0A941CPJ8_9CLOT|nr:segregation/condensation protein A [Proteiniclasticum sediminis]MBR0574941.1 segregation/condensation protein A [Proteiniclasticum sediminis]